MKKQLYILIALLMAVSMVLTSCAPATTAAPAEAVPAEATAAPAEAGVATAAPTATVVPTVMSGGEGCDPNAPKINWFVGLGGGTDPAVIPQEKAWVDKYNKSQTYACLVLQIVHNPESYDALRAMIAAGNPPDIVGPVGKLGRENFRGGWADITPLAEANNIDISNYDPALLNFLKDNGVQIGLPFALFPGVIFYNKALFDEAQLPYPPHKMDEQYQGKPWTWDALTELAKILTVDKAGNDATNPAFDNTAVTQFGMWMGFSGGRRMTAPFGGAVPYVGEDYTTAVIPQQWKDEWTWYYNGIWAKDAFMPNGDYANSDLFGKGNPFSSGNVAMTWTPTWYTCCFDLANLNWDMAVVPPVNGTLTAGIDGDTFSIPIDSKNQTLAFKVMKDMVMDADLGPIYGGIPGNPDLRQAFFDGMNAKSGSNTIDWNVAVDMLPYPDVPHHEAWMPNMSKAESAIDTFKTMLDTTAGLDLNAEIAKLQDTLTTLYKEAP
jgi:multiple sugar transport system substrate-binding protein